MKGSVTTTPGPSLAKEGRYYVHVSLFIGAGPVKPCFAGNPSDLFNRAGPVKPCFAGNPVLNTQRDPV